MNDSIVRVECDNEVWYCEDNKGVNEIVDAILKLSKKFGKDNRK